MQEWMILLLKVSNEQEILMSVFGKKELGKKEMDINPEKPDVPLNKNDAFQKVQKRRVQEKR